MVQASTSNTQQAASSCSSGRTPSHLMSGVVRLEESYDMFMEPAGNRLQEMFMEPAGNRLHSRRCDHNLHASPSGCSRPPSPAVLRHAAKQGVGGCVALSQHSTPRRKWAPGWGAQRSVAPFM